MKRILLITTTVLSLGATNGFAAVIDNTGKNYVTLKTEFVSPKDHSYSETSSDDDFDYTANVDVKNNNVPGYGFAVGRHFTKNLRGEIEVVYRDIEIDSTINLVASSKAGGDDISVTGLASGALKTWTTSVNGYYDFDTGTNFVPYVGAGVGYSKQTNGTKGDAIAYQGMAGLSYNLTENGSVYGGYRYFTTSEYHSELGGIDTTAHIGEVGYRIVF